MFSHVALIRLRRGQERFHSARPGSAPDAAGLSAPPGSSSSRHLPAPGSGSSSRRCAEQRERERLSELQVKSTVTDGPPEPGRRTLSRISVFVSQDPERSRSRSRDAALHVCRQRVGQLELWLLEARRSLTGAGSGPGNMQRESVERMLLTCQVSPAQVRHQTAEAEWRKVFFLSFWSFWRVSSHS